MQVYTQLTHQTEHYNILLCNTIEEQKTNTNRESTVIEVTSAARQTGRFDIRQSTGVYVSIA